MSPSRLAICASAAILLAACSEDTIINSGDTGAITLRTVCDCTVVHPDGSKSTVPAPESEYWNLTMASADGSYSHTWTPASLFPADDRYLPGSYTAVFYSGSEMEEGPLSPHFEGSISFMVENGGNTEVTVTATLASTPVQVSLGDRLAEYFPGTYVILHTPGGGFVRISEPEVTAYMNPLDIDVYVCIPMSGNELSLQPLTLKGNRPGYVTALAVEYDPTTDALTLTGTTCGATETETVVIDEALLRSPAPEIIAEGFIPDTPLSVAEGSVPAGGASMRVDSRTPVKSAFLTIRSQQLLELGIPAEADLLNLSASDRAAFARVGFNTSALSAEGGTLDFNPLISKLIYDTGGTNTSSFALVVKDALTRTSLPVSLEISTKLAGLNVTKVSKAEIGDPSVTITVEASDVVAENCGAEISVDGGNTWTEARILGISENSGNIYSVEIGLPDGIDPVLMRILYCGQVRSEFTIPRTSPAFSFEADPFANVAQIRINPEKPAVRELITEYVCFYIGSYRLPVLNRDIENGCVTIMGLKPDTGYTIRASIMNNPGEDDFTAPVSIHTESAGQLPNSDFEDTKENIKIDNMESGGRFSQNFVAIYDRQNYTSYNLRTPEKWSNTNPKTLSGSARNRNTWYLQPSAFIVENAVSGAYAVELVSTAFDINGAPIPPYLQESEPFINYSRNIPAIAHRAAGKLFLGDYSFNPETLEENYGTGIEFKSRPLSLNGYYRFIPSTDSRNERGLIRVEVLGMVDGVETVISQKDHQLPVALGYTAFNVTLDYPMFGVKATRLKVMFATSAHIGTIAEEDASIHVIADPETSSATGNRLWIDNISLGY